MPAVGAGHGYVTVKIEQQPAKTARREYVCAYTRMSRRREFSFHGQKDNPSLCHFSSVFLSPWLIELLRPRPRISVTFHFLPVSVSSVDVRTTKSRRFQGYTVYNITLLGHGRNWISSSSPPVRTGPTCYTPPRLSLSLPSLSLIFTRWKDTATLAWEEIYETSVIV